MLLLVLTSFVASLCGFDKMAALIGADASLWDMASSQYLVHNATGEIVCVWDDGLHSNSGGPWELTGPPHDPFLQSIEGGIRMDVSALLKLAVRLRPPNDGLPAECLVLNSESGAIRGTLFDLQRQLENRVLHVKMAGETTKLGAYTRVAPLRISGRMHTVWVSIPWLVATAFNDSKKGKCVFGRELDRYREYMNKFGVHPDHIRDSRHSQRMQAVSVQERPHVDVSFSAEEHATCTITGAVFILSYIASSQRFREGELEVDVALRARNLLHGIVAQWLPAEKSVIFCDGDVKIPLLGADIMEEEFKDIQVEGGGDNRTFISLGEGERCSSTVVLNLMEKLAKKNQWSVASRTRRFCFVRAFVFGVDQLWEISKLNTGYWMRFSHMHLGHLVSGGWIQSGFKRAVVGELGKARGEGVTRASQLLAGLSAGSEQGVTP